MNQLNIENCQSSIADQAEQILSGPDYFMCERTHTRMKKEICIKRQTSGLRIFGGSWKYAREIPSECVNCEQGRNLKKKGKIMKNKLLDLNDHLFAQVERLSDEDLKGDALREEIGRAKSVSNVAAQIIKNGNLALKAQVALNDGLINRAPKMLGVESGVEGDKEDG